MMLPVIALIFVISILIGMPIAFGMGLAGATWILFFEGMEASILVRRAYTVLSSFPLLAIPLFIMIGLLAERCGMLPELVRWLQLLLGRLRGGMAYINVAASMAFAGVSGTAVSDVASLGRVEIEMMRQAGYPVPYSAALTAASSIIGPIIPPSVAMIIYALAAGNVSIAGLFMAGAVPGVLLGVGLIGISWFKARKGNYGTTVENAGLASLLRQTARVLPLLALPVVIVGGIVSGVFTVTESAAVGVIYTLFIGFAITRRLTVRDVYDATVYSAVISSVVGMLMAAGGIISWILTRNQVTQQLADWLVTVTADPTLFLLLIAAALIVLGTIMDATAIIIALAPLIAPIARQYGIDDLQFGIVFVLSCMIGMITPPVGIILFMTATVAEISLESISAAILPFVALMIALLFLVAVVPSLTLWLPGLFGLKPALSCRSGTVPNSLATLGRRLTVAPAVEGGIAGGRTGCRAVEDALEVAQAVRACSPHLALRGVEGFEGLNAKASDEAIAEFIGFLVQIAEACDRKDLFSDDGPVLLSAGGSAYFDIVIDVFARAKLNRPTQIVTRSGCYITTDSGMYVRAFERIFGRSPELAELGPAPEAAIEIWAYVQSRPETAKVILTMGKRDVSYDVDLPVALRWFRPGNLADPLPIPPGHLVTGLNDQHAHMTVPADSPLRVGDMVGFGISHPCTTFDKWEILYVIDDRYNVVDVVRTYF